MDLGNADLNATVRAHPALTELFLDLEGTIPNLDFLISWRRRFTQHVVDNRNLLVLQYNIPIWIGL